MNTDIQFNRQSIFTNSLCVEDIGNCALEAVDNLGQYYYFVIKTIRGISYILTYGPLVPDIDILPKTYNLNYYNTSYADAKIVKAIQTWACAPKGLNFEEITQIPVEEALVNCRDIKVCFENIE